MDTYESRELLPMPLAEMTDEELAQARTNYEIVTTKQKRKKN